MPAFASWTTHPFWAPLVADACSYLPCSRYLGQCDAKTLNPSSAGHEYPAVYIKLAGLHRHFLSNNNKFRLRWVFNVGENIKCECKAQVYPMTAGSGLWALARSKPFVKIHALRESPDQKNPTATQLWRLG